MMTVFISKYFSHYQSKSLTVSYVLLKLTASSAYKNDKWHFDQSFLSFVRQIILGRDE